VVDRDTAVLQHQLKIAVADREHQVPAHGPQDHLGRELPAFELLALRHDTCAAIRLVETARLSNPDPPHKLATDPLDVLEREQDIDLLFTDVIMPGGMTGRQLAEEASRRRPGLRILFTTGYSRNAIVHHGRLDPGIELISKPFAQDQLSAKLRELLDRDAPRVRS
jgi:CheY-like chemotaxis protein